MRTMSGGFCLHYDCSNRNSFGYCKTTACINEHYQQEQLDFVPSTTNKIESVVIKRQTNADRIRAMSDEELATLLTDVAKKFAEKLCESLKIVDVDISNCYFDILYKVHLDWLKKEVEE